MKIQLLILFFFISSCKDVSRSRESNPRQDRFTSTKLPDSLKKADREIQKKDGNSDTSSYFLHPNGSKDISKFYDSALNNIPLENCNAAEKKFGNNINLLPDIEDFPRIEVVNFNKNQLFTLFMHNGNTKCFFSEYQIEYLKPNYKFDQKPFLFQEKSFISSRNISLGMSIKELKTRFGVPNESRMEASCLVLCYQEYNGFYFGDYYFKDGKLFKFRYGFEYP